MHFGFKGRAGLRAALFVALTLATFGQSDDLARKSTQVKELMAAGRFGEAVPLCQHLVHALPENPGLRLNLALALYMSGRNREAVPEFERVLKSQPNSVPALLSLGVARVQLNDPAGAIAPLGKVVRLEPANRDARGMLASALLMLERAKEAAPHFRKLAELSPQDPKVWHGLSRCYEILANQAFQELEKTSPGSPEWLSLVAESRMARHQYRSAFFFYRQALEKNPQFRPALSGIADVYAANGNAEWAAAQVKREKALPPQDCTREKSACDYMAGRYAEAAASPSPFWRARAYNQLAIQALEKLGTLPESVEVHAVKAEIAGSQGRLLDAANEWRAALKLVPGDPGLTQQLAIALHDAGDYKSALPMLQDLEKAGAKSPELAFLIGDSYLRLEQPATALPYLETATQGRPKFAPAHASLGLAYALTGSAAKAIPQLELALSTDDDGSLHYQLARAYQSTGNAEKARELMTKYQKIQTRIESEKRDLEEKAQITAPSQ
jgi:predicted Zn-dependent protease